MPINHSASTHRLAMILSELCEILGHGDAAALAGRTAAAIQADIDSGSLAIETARHDLADQLLSADRMRR